jgi:hypothetical protein
VVREGPDANDVPALIDALVQSLHTGLNTDPVVRSAVTHLNLVMIHPFRDGDGRMARAQLAVMRGLPDRTIEAMFDAVLGYRVPGVATLSGLSSRSGPPPGTWLL